MHRFFQRAGRALLTCAIAATLTGTAAESRAQAFYETYVEPCFLSCDDAPIDPWGQAAIPNLPHRDVDGDAADCDPAGGFNEDADGDAVFTTIQTATDNTISGGVVHVTVPGVYRESLTIDNDDNITIRAPEGTDVVLDGSRAWCDTPGATTYGILFGGSLPRELVLQNITIRGWDVGIATLEDEQSIRLIGCRLEDNGIGVYTAGSQDDLSATDTRFVGAAGYGTGLYIAGTLATVEVTGCQFLRLATGAYGGSTGGMTFTDTRFFNGSTGIQTSNTTPPTYVMTVVDCSFDQMERGIDMSGNSEQLQVTGSSFTQCSLDGVLFRNNTTLRAGTATFARNSFLGNSGDGVELYVWSGVAATIHSAFYQNVFATNVSASIRKTQLAGTINVKCNDGFNLFVNNTSGFGDGLSGLTCSGGPSGILNMK
jgi:hypothetical protein